MLESPPPESSGLHETLNQVTSGRYHQFQQNMNNQMMENFITVRVYLNVNDDDNNELFKKIFPPQKADQSLQLVSPTSSEHLVKIQGDEQAYIDVRTHLILF